MGQIIVIEDNPIFADYVCRLLVSKGFKSETALTCNGARKLFAGMQEDDIVLADMRLPDGDGIAMLEELRKQGKNNPYIVMTEHGDIPVAVRSLKLGAEDFIPKDLLEMNLLPLLRSLQKRMERQDAPILERTSGVFKKIYDKIRLVAPTNMSVLILGESGTGKEHIAEKIHARSKRAAGPFVPVDCGLLLKELAASELFGYEKGAFTGADSKRKGVWEDAHVVPRRDRQPSAGSAADAAPCVGVQAFQTVGQYQGQNSGRAHRRRHQRGLTDRHCRKAFPPRPLPTIERIHHTDTTFAEMP